MRLSMARIWTEDYGSGPGDKILLQPQISASVLKLSGLVEAVVLPQGTHSIFGALVAGQGRKSGAKEFDL
jgi:hypothetical protein